jgi:hypothetical protein
VSEVIISGLDIAKHVLHVHGAEIAGIDRAHPLESDH